MVRRLLTLLDREIRGLHEAAYLLAGFALVSQILALLRDRTFAHYFGAGPTLDMYFAAFRVPDAVFAILTLTVSSFALIPLFTREPEDTRAALMRSVLFYFGVLALPLTALVALAVPYLMPWFVPGFTAAAVAQTTTLALIMLLQPLLLGVSSIVSSYVQSSRRFMLFALAPIFYNLGIMVGAIALYPLLGLPGLAWGVVLGALLHLLIQLAPLSLHKSGERRLSFSEFLAEVLSPSVPRAVALMGNQFLLIAFAAIATVIAAGAVSSMTFAFNLQSVPLTVIGLSYASALFPALSAMVHRGEWDAFAAEVWATVRHIAFWLLPATMFLIVLRAHVVRVVLGSGAFSWDDTRLTAAVLALFCVSLVGQASILAFSRAYYAAGKTWLPILLNVGGSFAAALLAYVLVSGASSFATMHYFVESLFRVGDVPGTLVLLIPGAYSAVTLLVALVFALSFARMYGADALCLRSLGASFSASVLGAGAAYLALQAFGPLLPTNTFLGIFAQGAGAGFVGLLAWVAVLALMRSQEFADVVALSRKKFFVHDVSTHP